MIPILCIIAGILLGISGIIGLLSLLFLPFKRMTRIVYDKEDDFLKYESNSGKRVFKRNLKQLTWVYVGMIFFGVILFCGGIYLGYAAKGDSFWFYRQIFGEDVKEDYLEQITEEGKFAANNGKEYTYYILVEGEEYIFSGEKCADFDELKEKVKDIRIGNPVILIDNYAVSSKYHAAENLLKESGLKYETEEE